MGPKGITVNIVASGMVEIDRTSGASEVKQKIAAFTLLGRIKTPEDVARVVAFFASDDAGFYTGMYFPVDGGLHLS